MLWLKFIARNFSQYKDNPQLPRRQRHFPLSLILTRDSHMPLPFTSNACCWAEGEGISGKYLNFYCRNFTITSPLYWGNLQFSKSPLHALLCPLSLFQRWAVHMSFFLITKQSCWFGSRRSVGCVYPIFSVSVSKMFILFAHQIWAIVVPPDGRNVCPCALLLII